MFFPSTQWCTATEHIWLCRKKILCQSNSKSCTGGSDFKVVTENLFPSLCRSHLRQDACLIEQITAIHAFIVNGGWNLARSQEILCGENLLYTNTIIHLSGRSESPPCHITKCKLTISSTTRASMNTNHLQSVNYIFNFFMHVCLVLKAIPEIKNPQKPFSSWRFFKSPLLCVSFIHMNSQSLITHHFMCHDLQKSPHFAGCLLEIKLWLMGTMHTMLLRSRQIDLSGWGVGFASHSSCRFYQLICLLYYFFMTFRMTIMGWIILTKCMYHTVILINN